MAKQHKLTVRIDDDIRDKAHEAAKELGLSLSDYVRGQIERLVRQREIRQLHAKYEQELIEIESSIEIPK